MMSICIGVYLCHRTAKDMGTHDHGSIVWDEFVGMWITLMALPTMDWQWVAAGFVIFRIFDMWKPWPIRWFDPQYPRRNGDYGRRHRRRRDLRWRAVRHWPSLAHRSALTASSRQRYAAGKPRPSLQIPPPDAADTAPPACRSVPRRASNPPPAADHRAVPDATGR